MEINEAILVDFINKNLIKLEQDRILKLLKYYEESDILKVMTKLKIAIKHKGEKGVEDFIEDFRKCNEQLLWNEKAMPLINNFLKSQSNVLKHYNKVKDEYCNVLFCNLNLYYYLSNTETTDLINDIIMFIWLRAFFPSIMFGTRPHDFKQNIAAYFLALKWFYSEKTKHLYSEELLRKMSEYEKTIKDIKWEDCIEEENKYFRLRF